MKKIMIDINIIMDFLFKRSGHEEVAEALSLCIKNNIELFICAHELTTLFYFLDKEVKDKIKIRRVLTIIMNHFDIIEVNKGILYDAVYSRMDDFEDAVIDVSSNKNGIDYIVTRNMKDFDESITKAITVEEMINLLKGSL
jgi:predicted nucleic acid-binding protein